MAKAFVAEVCLLWLVVGAVACGEPSAEAVPEERTQVPKSIEQVLQEHTDSLMALPGVVGTALGLCADEPCIRVFVVEATEDLLKHLRRLTPLPPIFIQEYGGSKRLMNEK